jgi:hypothetical protein
MSYQAVSGWNNPGTLIDLDPQPATPDAMQVAREVEAASGLTYADGKTFVELVYTILQPEEFTAINTQLGGLSVTMRSAEVTVRVKGNDDTYANYNAIAHYPKRIQRTPTGFRNVTYEITLVEAL